MSHIVIVVNSLSFFISHRFAIAVDAVKSGRKVTVLAKLDCSNVDLLYDNGIGFHEIKIDRKSRNIFLELQAFLQILAKFKTLKPSSVHLVTIKAVLYGGIAALICRVPALFAISGLGGIFSNSSNYRLRKLVSVLYRLLFNYSKSHIVVQNESDFRVIESLVSRGSDKITLIPGSGVNVGEIEFIEEPDDTTVVIAFAARLLKDKGILELISAVALLNSTGVNCRLIVAGDIDYGNSNSVSESEVERWKGLGFVEVLGFTSDVISLYQRSHIVSLPSYYGEGIPKSLIEAAAVGRPIVTTDQPGCRAAVIENKTGFLVGSRDPVDLSNKLRKLIENRALRKVFGLRARQFAIEKFQLSSVVKKHLELYEVLERES